jgi:hypothetical protein
VEAVSANCGNGTMAAIALGYGEGRRMSCGTAAALQLSPFLWEIWFGPKIFWPAILGPHLRFGGDTRG